MSEEKKIVIEKTFKIIIKSTTLTKETLTRIIDMTFSKEKIQEVTLIKEQAVKE